MSDWMELDYIEAKLVVGKYTSADEAYLTRDNVLNLYHAALLYARAKSQSLTLRHIAFFSLCILCFLHVRTDRLDLQLDVADLVARVVQP